MVADGEPFLNTGARIDYRDDGMARVAEERFDYGALCHAHARAGHIV